MELGGDTRIIEAEYRNKRLTLYNGYLEWDRLGTNKGYISEQNSIDLINYISYWLDKNKTYKNFKCNYVCRECKKPGANRYKVFIQHGKLFNSNLPGDLKEYDKEKETGFRFGVSCYCEECIKSVDTYDEKKDVKYRFEKVI